MRSNNTASHGQKAPRLEAVYKERRHSVRRSTTEKQHPHHRGSRGRRQRTHDGAIALETRVQRLCELEQTLLVHVEAVAVAVRFRLRRRVDPVQELHQVVDSLRALPHHRNPEIDR